MRSAGPTPTGARGGTEVARRNVRRRESFAPGLAAAALVACAPAFASLPVCAQEADAGRPGSSRALEAARECEAPTDLPADLAKVVSDYDRATTRNDVATLAALVADDYLLVNSDSSLQDKRSYLEDFKLPGFKVDPYVIDQPVRKVFKDAAMTGGLLPLEWTQDGARHQRLLRVVHVWAKQNGRWRLTYTQLTRVPQERAAGSVYKRSAGL